MFNRDLKERVERLERREKMRLQVVDENGEADYMLDVFGCPIPAKKDVNIHDVLHAMALEFGYDLVYRRGSSGIELKERD